MMNLLVANESLLFGGRFRLGEKKTRLRVSYCPAGVRASAANMARLHGDAPRPDQFALLSRLVAVRWAMQCKERLYCMRVVAG